MDTTTLERFRDKIGKGPVYGPFCKTCDPAVIEALGYGGFDFVILDMEHGPNGIETMQHLVRAAEIAGLVSIIRVPSGSEEMISKALDIGATGVQVPQIGSADQVEQAREAAKFSPMGSRGVCRYVRAANYSSMPKEAYFRQANDALLVVQLEGQAALDNLDAILAVEGIDIVFIGPYDLSQSLGVPGQTDHPLVVEKTSQIVKACLDKGIAVGNFTETPEQTAAWTKRGLRYMSFAVDIGIVYEASRRLVAAFKATQ